MLKVPLPFLFLLAAATGAGAQNLVPNPSFEDTSNCMTTDYEYMLGLSRPWYSPNGATPDIYDAQLVNTCGVLMDLSNPDVVEQGYQSPFSGHRFAGAYVWQNGARTKDYLAVRLLDTLQAGHVYNISFHTSLAEGAGYAVDRISVLFSMDSIHIDDYGVLPEVPQIDIIDPAFFTNTDQWMELQGVFVADGGEAFMVIGSFQDSAEVNALEVIPSLWSVSYYYYDSIAVSEAANQEAVEEPCELVTQGESILGIQWLGTSGIDHLLLYNAAGKVLIDQRERLGRGPTLIERTRILPSGLYIVEAWSGTRRAISKWEKLGEP